MSVASVQPHQVPVRRVVLSGADHHERGLARGGELSDGIHATVRGYHELFDHHGITAADQRGAAEASLDALRTWDPRQHEEVLGVAAGAGLAPQDLAAVLARTEILTLSPRPPAECSTVAHQAPGRSVSAQTWDWYARFATRWHVHTVRALPGEQTHAGFAEYGMTGKIGLNSAGVGVHLNILQHRDDTPGGVPIHAVLARILTEATSVAEGVEIIRSAGTTSSSLVTLVDADEVAMVEIAPDGVSVVSGPGWNLHTNHFLAPERQGGGLVLASITSTYDRLDHLERSTATRPAPASSGRLLPTLCSPLEDASIALLPDASQPEDEQAATLVTVHLDPAQGLCTISPGVPQYADDNAVVLTPRSPAEH